MMQLDKGFDDLKGFIVRSPELADGQIVTDLLNTCSMEVVGRKQYDADELRVSWQSPNFDYQSSIQLVLAEGGGLAGFCSINDTQDPYVRIMIMVRVHPDYRQSRIGEALLGWGEKRARAAVGKAPEGAQVVLSSGVNQKDTYHKHLLESHGMTIARHFFQMEIEFDGPPESPDLPAGIVIRPYDEDTELESLASAYLDSFQDHYGFADQSIDTLLVNIRFMIEKDPNYSPDLWFVAMDGDEIAGLSVCTPKTTEDPEMGFVNVLGVRRHWRRKGLGLALLGHSFVEFYRRGCKRAGLGVDASSLTGATRLYEKGGMHVARQFDSYKKVLRDGDDITTKSL